MSKKFEDFGGQKLLADHVTNIRVEWSTTYPSRVLATATKRLLIYNERSVKEAKKRFKEARKESVGQVHSQSEPSEVGPYQGRDPRRKNKLPGF